MVIAAALVAAVTIGNGNRIDRSVGNQLNINDFGTQTRVEACHYDHAPRESKASDHSVMTLELLKMG
jgi:hypothetical protein